MDKTLTRKKRQARIRAKISGTPSCPRAAVYRSNRYISVQLIDDTVGKIILSATYMSDKEAKGTKKERAKQIGELLGKQAKEKGIERVAFDRAGYKYHGRVKEVAEGLRSAGLQF